MKLDKVYHNTNHYAPIKDHSLCSPLQIIPHIFAEMEN